MRWSGCLVLVALGTACLLAGCPDGEEVGTGGSAANSAVLSTKIKDYLFPPSAQSKYTYLSTSTLEVVGQPTEVSTASLTLKVVSHTLKQAVLTFDFMSSKESTATIAVNPDGSLAATTSLYVFGLTITSPFDLTNAILTPAGQELLPASGNTPASTWSKEGAEALTVPAGTFQCAKTRLGIGKSAPYYLWLSKGVPVRMSQVATGSSAQGAVSTSSVDYVLQEYTK